jgi:hypothetical protein
MAQPSDPVAVSSFKRNWKRWIALAPAKAAASIVLATVEMPSVTL